MKDESAGKVKLTGPQWLVAMDVLMDRVRTASDPNVPPGFQRDVAEALVRDELIDMGQLLRFVEERPGRLRGEFSISNPDDVPGCTEAACETVDVHEHGPACSTLCPDCRGQRR